MFCVASGRSFRDYFSDLNRLLVLPVRENRQVFQETTKEGERYQDNILGELAEWEGTESDNRARGTAGVRISHSPQHNRYSEMERRD